MPIHTVHVEEMSGLCYQSQNIFNIPRKGSRIEYILDTTGLFESSRIAISSSDRCIRIIDPSTQAALVSLFGHGSTITCLTCSNASQSILYSCSLDKSMAMWDERVSFKPIRKLLMGGEVNAVSVSKSDHLVAVAVEQDISIYDIRKLRDHGTSPKLFFYDEMHSDVVTNLSFSHSEASILMSGAEDGLICFSDTNITDYDESTATILNTDCPVRRFGYYGHDSIYSLSTVETVSFWSYDTAQRIAQFNDFREEQNVDYMVDCFGESSSLFLLAGRYDGRGSLFSLENQTLAPYSALENGHVDTIRCCFYMKHGGESVLFTGGEDGKLLGWRVPAADCADAEKEEDAEYSVGLEKNDSDHNGESVDCKGDFNDHDLDRHSGEMVQGTHRQGKRRVEEESSEQKKKEKRIVSKI